ncbi:DEAD/DEAH box helicase [Arthrobacter crystallopoietes]|uniref:DEAD/DEAH box helicase n=1 Tax=Crystallibacter crystallopoietes TaxID=37928 RepID=UPI003D212864
MLEQWAGNDGTIAEFIRTDAQSALEAYRVRPDLVREHSNIEQSISQSGYGRKQLNELIQNAADALLGHGGRIAVVLTDDALYCANEGEAFTQTGYQTLMLSHSSEKRDDQIGRFGLGFKSVLQVSDDPQIFSRTGSVGWSKLRSTQLLGDVYPNLATYPVLRMAEPLDPKLEAEKDSELKALMAWATTVVKLPLRANVSWLHDEVKDFPHHFLLFSKDIHELRLIDRVKSYEVAWTASRDGGRIHLSNGNASEDWLLLEYNHRVSEAAAADAGSIFARSEVPVSWAVPLNGNPRSQLGTFWNYFPTNHRTSLRGIINAAFKMNEDRFSMLETLYNREILTKALPSMVAGALQLLSTTEDPAAHFDVLPSRFKENEGWSDRIIYEPIMDVVSTVPFLPDRAGRLQPVSSIKIQPEFNEAAELERLWNAAVGADRPWLHQSAFANKERNSLVNRVLAKAQVRRSTVTEWLEEVVCGNDLKNFENALEIAAYIDKRLPEHMQAMRRSNIVLMSDGEITAPIKNRIFLPSDPEDAEDNLVSYDLLHYGQSVTFLKQLGLEVLNGTGKLKKVARDVAEDYQSKTSAESLWRVGRTFPIDEVVEILSEQTDVQQILVKCMSNEWRPLASAWLPGRLLDPGRLEDSHRVVDPLFHGKDLDLFRRLGMRATLPEQGLSRSGNTYELWKTAEARRLSKESEDSPQPVSVAALKFGQVQLTERLDELRDASPQARALVTKQLLSRPPSRTRVEYSSSYKAPSIIDGPDLWWVRNFGILDTPLGLVETRYCTGLPEGFPQDFLPFPGSEEAAALGLPKDPKNMPWSFILPLAERSISLENVHVLYGLLAKHDVKAPKDLLVAYGPSRTTRYSSKDVNVATDATSHEYLASSAHHASIFTGHSELDDALVERWGLKTLSVVFSADLQVTENTGSDRQRPNELFPHIDRASRVKRSALCIPCTSIERVRRNSVDDKTVRETLDIALDEENAYVYYNESLTRRRLLQGLLNVFNETKPLQAIEDKCKALAADAKQQELEDKIRNANGPAEKLMALVGREALVGLIPEAVQEMLRLRRLILTDQLIFDVVSNLYGANLMQRLEPALNQSGISNAEMFQGKTSDARAFLRDLGFAPELISEPLARKPSREEIVGPVRLKALHAYQKSTAEKLKILLSGKSDHHRGVVQLPTGAGKTRVAAQSVVEHVAEQAKPQLVVWIAHSEELCEQAIESWSNVWQAVGPDGERMAVSRLWGGNSAQQENTRLHLVVATIQTLSRIADEADRGEPRGLKYSWLSNPDIVIIDEAHGAIATSYTGVLKWMKRSARNSTGPLIGLSATPYRGTNEVETERLVNRFEANLIEPDEFSAEDAHEYLQGIRVLARVKHEVLEGIKLTQRITASERNLPEDDARNAMLDQRVDLDLVAASAERNERILAHLSDNQDSIAHALVFAASVDHAEALAAVLSATGIPAASISGRTGSAHRRSLIERFRKGELKVLTNFDVLSQGFDAPKVDAVYLCRPTFSPNKYIQMVGRGLRGPANGGSEEVLVVNIQDNLDQFGTKLAYTEFDYLWNRAESHAV